MTQARAYKTVNKNKEDLIKKEYKQGRHITPNNTSIAL